MSGEVVRKGLRAALTEPLDERDKTLREYLDTMKQHASEESDYTPDFIAGFEHALKVVAACEEPAYAGHVKPEVRIAAQHVLDARGIGRVDD